MDFIIMVDRINKIPLKNQQYMSDFMRFLELDSECIDLSIDLPPAKFLLITIFSSYFPKK